jgi:hypothetical protein
LRRTDPDGRVAKKSKSANRKRIDRNGKECIEYSKVLNSNLARRWDCADRDAGHLESQKPQEGFEIGSEKENIALTTEQEGL